MYGTFYRHMLLPLFDRVLKGRRTLDYWAEAEERQWWPRERLEAFQREALRRLLIHAFETCPYYRKAWEAEGLNPYKLASLEEFTRWPLLTREEIRRNRPQMRTTAPLTLLSKATGGSSGEPLHFDLDTGSDQRRTAMMYRGYGWAGAAPGTKQLFLWGRHVGPVSRFRQWKAALHQRFDRQKKLSCFEMTPETMRRYLGILNRYRPDVLIAYTNPLYEFARFLAEERLAPVSPRSIVVGAEKLHDFQRETIEAVFGAPVFETYGSREFMLIGAECERHAGLHLSSDNLLVEILDDDGRPAAPGEEGNVVVTDLFNFGLPFVRYVNGDRAVAGCGDCPCGRGLPLLQNVSGRRLDVLDMPDGRQVPGELFPHLLKEFPSVRRFQVVQHRPGSLTLKLVVDDRFTEADRALLLTEVFRCTGEQADVRLEFVDDIPLSRSGKLRVVVRDDADARTDHGANAGVPATGPTDEEVAECHEQRP